MEDFNFELFRNYTQSIILSLVIFLILGFEIWLIKKGSNYLKNKVLGFKSSFLKVKSVEFISRGKQRLVLIGLINLFQIIIILSIVYLSFLLILILFPGNSDLVTKLINFIFIPLKITLANIINYFPRLFSIIIIVIIFRYLFNLIRTLAIEVEKGTIKLSMFKPLWARTTGKIINFILFALMLIFILPLMPGYDSLAFKGISAFIALLITIGGSSVISNYMSGIVISFMNPCRVGDFIKIDNLYGEVIEMSQFAIKILTVKKIIVTVPYTKSLNSSIINYSADKENQSIILNTRVSIGYNISWEKVNELLLGAASLTEFVDQTQPPFVRQIKLDQFYIVYEINVYTTKVKMMHHIYSELHKHILDVFKKEDIEILSPHYQVER